MRAATATIPHTASLSQPDRSAPGALGGDEARTGGDPGDVRGVENAPTRDHPLQDGRACWRGDASARDLGEAVEGMALLGEAVKKGPPLGE